jgi:hypothetical protein
MQVSEYPHIEFREICDRVIGNKWGRCSHTNKYYLSIHNIFVAQISHHQVILEEIHK